jgi:hypothetical protein
MFAKAEAGAAVALITLNDLKLSASSKDAGLVAEILMITVRPIVSRAA